MTVNRTLDLLFPAGESTVVFNPKHQEQIFYNQIRLKEYSISLIGTGNTLPAKLNLKASENIFNCNIAHGTTSPSFSIPIVLHNRQEQNGGEFTTFDFHYPYPFIVGQACTKRPDVATFIPGNIQFSLYDANTNAKVTLFANSSIVFELVGGKNEYITDQMNPKLNIPHSYH